jgi:hypothetical protein
MLPDWKNQKDVENRDYHHLSQSEIAGDKRISRHLSNFPAGIDRGSAIHGKCLHAVNAMTELRGEWRPLLPVYSIDSALFARTRTCRAA